MTDSTSARMTAERARGAVRRAILRGEMERPLTCQECGKTPAPMKNGFPGIQAHHHDYSKPLDVEWLCARCHRLVTPIPEKFIGGARYGEQHGLSKLTRKDVEYIRSSPLSGADIARELGLNRSTVNRARAGITWIVNP